MGNSHRFMLSTLFISLVIPMVLSLLVESTISLFFDLPLTSVSFLILTLILFLENFTLELYQLKRLNISWRSFILEALVLIVGFTFLVSLFRKLFPSSEEAITFIQGVFYASLFLQQTVFSRVLFYRLKTGYEFSETIENIKDSESGVHVRVSSSYAAARRILFILLIILCVITMMMMQWHGEFPPSFLTGSLIFLILILFSRYLIRNNERNIYWLLRGQKLPPLNPKPIIILSVFILVLLGISFLLSFTIPTLNLSGLKQLLKRFFLWIGEHIEKKEVILENNVIEQERDVFTQVEANYEETPVFWQIFRYSLLAIPVLFILSLILWPVLKMLSRYKRTHFVKESLGGWRTFFSQLALFFRDLFHKPDYEKKEYSKIRRSHFNRWKKKKKRDFTPDKEFEGFFRIILWGEEQDIKFTSDMAPAEYTASLSKSFPSLKEELERLGELFDQLFYSVYENRDWLLNEIDKCVNRIISRGRKNDTA